MNDRAWVLALLFCSAATVSALSLPFWRGMFFRRNWVDEPGRRKMHGGRIALAGGMAVFGGLLAGLFTLLFVVGRGGEAFEGADGPPFYRPIAIVISGAAAMLLLGWWDDLVDLRPSFKFGGQMMVAIATVAAGVRLPVLSGFPIIQVLLSVFFLLAVVNAVNFLDNMNGLCAGLGAVALLQTGVAGWMNDQPILASIALAGAGACCGYLPFNYPKASAFLGDSGSHLIGYLMATLLMFIGSTGSEKVEVNRIVGTLLILAVPAYDLIQVVLLRIRLGQPVYVGDSNHVSHQLVRLGFSPARVVVLLWAIAALVGAVGVFLMAR